MCENIIASDKLIIGVWSIIVYNYYLIMMNTTTHPFLEREHWLLY